MVKTHSSSYVLGLLLLGSDWLCFILMDRVRSVFDCVSLCLSLAEVKCFVAEIDCVWVCSICVNVDRCHFECILVVLFESVRVYLLLLCCLLVSFAFVFGLLDFHGY